MRLTMYFSALQTSAARQLGDASPWTDGARLRLAPDRGSAVRHRLNGPAM